jgi:hypothetical protein
VLHRALEGIWEQRFPAFSFAYRRGKGVGDAARAVEHSLRSGQRQVGGADIDNFFDSVD